MTLAADRLGKIALVVLVLLIASSVGVASDDDYHLTGVIGSETGKAFAVIEQADGQQRLLGQGDSIGGGYVSSISTKSKTVVLTFPDGEMSLTLKGSSTPGEYQEEYEISQYLEEVKQESLDKETIVKLEILAGDSEKLSETERVRRLNKLLGLSEQARIATYNNVEVESTHELLQQLVSASVEGHMGAIAVSDAKGNQRIYLSANSE